MEGHLERLCSENEIDLEFITGKFLELGKASEGKVHRLKAHKIFRDCPLEVAEAIVACCTENRIQNENIWIIEDFLKENLGLDDVKIDLKGKKISGEEAKKPLQNRRKDKEGNIEADISRIGVRNLWGDQRNFKKDDSLIPYEDDVLELNIVVEPPDT